MVKDWLNDITNDATKRNYRFWIKKFFDYLENVEKIDSQKFLSDKNNEQDLSEMKRIFRAFKSYESTRLQEIYSQKISKSAKGLIRRGDEYSWRQSVNNFLSAVKAFFEFLDENDYIKYNPIASQKFVDKVPRETIRKVLSMEDALRLLTAAKTFRHKIIINLLWETLGRLNVIQTLKYLHFQKHPNDTRYRHIYIPRTKRNKPLDTDISAELYDLIEKWTIERFKMSISEMKENNPTQNTVTTYASDYSPISASTIEKDINSVALKAGFDPILEPIFPHSFRHGGTTAIADLSDDESFLKRRGNWSSDKMVEKYRHKKYVKEDSQKMDNLFDKGYSLLKSGDKNE